MALTSFKLDVVSAEGHFFSGEALRIRVTGSEGELGIFPGHTALLTSIKPGMVGIVKEDGEEEIMYLSGGILEVQPTAVTILADTVIRANDLDQARAKAAVEKAVQKLKDQDSNISYAQASAELAKALAKIRVIQMTEKNRH